MNTVKVQIKSVFGNHLIYPANTEAQLFADIAGTKTLSQSDLQKIVKLGFVIEEVQYYKLACGE
jgi:hypothetical protein